MGHRFFDQYSLLHFAAGVVAYFWSISFVTIILIHVAFEYVENTTMGMNFINTYFMDWWPGGKTHADSLLNQASDTLFTGVGWLASYHLDRAYRLAS
jgi:hypothetical protein